MKRRYFLTGAIALGLTVTATATSCTSSSGGATRPSGGSSSGRSRGGTTGTPLATQSLLQNPDIKVDLLRLDRVADKVVVAKLLVRNGGTYDMDLGGTLSQHLQVGDDASTSDPNSVSRIALIDQSGSRLYFPLTDTARNCFCRRISSESLVVRKGQSYGIDVAFPAPPAALTKAGLFFPDSAPFLDIPLGRADSAAVTVDNEGTAVDPLRGQTAAPRVLPVVATTETPDGAEDDSGTDLSVRVSSDVLFALNKADLSSAAQRILRDVAGKIDNSSGSAVKVDGYTDNSGNDAINGPLSQRRAASVVDALKKLVTRPGITYQAAGHGSADPVAPNTTEAGRKTNRRVTVTFAKPQKADQAPSAPAAGSATIAPTLKILPSAVPGYVSLKWPHDTTVHIDGLRRFSSGFTVLTWTVDNQDPQGLDVSAFSALPEAGYKGASTSGATLTAGNVRYRALRDSMRTSLGPDFDVMSPVNVETIEKGEKLTLTALFKLPDDLKAVTVNIPGFQTADVPVQ